MKRMMRFGKKWKLNPIHVGPNKILLSLGKVSDELELLTKLAAVHLIIHILLLKKCVGDPTSIIPLESVVVKYTLTYKEVLVKILDWQVRRLFPYLVTHIIVVSSSTLRSNFLNHHALLNLSIKFCTNGTGYLFFIVVLFNSL